MIVATLVMTGRVVFVGVHVVVGAGVVIAGTDVVVGGSSSARLDVRARQGDKSGEGLSGFSDRSWWWPLSLRCPENETSCPKSQRLEIRIG